MERCQASCCARIPELDLMVFGPRDKETFGGMPVAGFDIPVVTGENGIASSRGEIEYLQRCVVGCGEEFSITW